MRSKFLDILIATLAVVTIVLFSVLLITAGDEDPVPHEVRKRAKLQRVRTAYDLCEDGSRAECALLQSFCTYDPDLSACFGLYPARSPRSQE